jgi:hypothetical protein
MLSSGDKLNLFIRKLNRPMIRPLILTAVLALSLPALTAAPAAAGDSLSPVRGAEPLMRVASGGPQQRPDALKADAQKADAQKPDEDTDGDEPELTQDQKFEKRFPQPVRVGDLIGLPVLDFDDSTIGYVADVARRPDGEVDLIVPYRAWFGFIRNNWGRRPVAVPIKTVAILARQIDALEFTRDDFAAAPDWKPADGTSLAPDEKTLIALGRR